MSFPLILESLVEKELLDAGLSCKISLPPLLSPDNRGPKDMPQSLAPAKMLSLRVEFLVYARRANCQQQPRVAMSVGLYGMIPDDLAASCALRFSCCLDSFCCRRNMQTSPWRSQNRVTGEAF